MQGGASDASREVQICLRPMTSEPIHNTLDGIDQLLAAHSSMVATVARREVTRIRDLAREANQLERDLSQQVTDLVPSLLKIPGCGALSAAKFLGEAADIARFKSRDAYAIWAGVAPIPMWSANTERLGWYQSPRV